MFDFGGEFIEFYFCWLVGYWGFGSLWLCDDLFDYDGDNFGGVEEKDFEWMRFCMWKRKIDFVYEKE